MSRYSPLVIGALFAAAALGAVGGVADPVWRFGPFAVDELTLFLAAAVTLVSGVVHVFARRYMDGDARFAGFFKRLTGLTGVVLLLLAADHMLLFAAAWLGMGWLLADLIGHVRSWPQAQAAARLARGRFLIGGGALALALLLLGLETGEATISGAIAAVGGADAVPVVAAVVLLAIAAAIQCGLVPFHRWLLSSMTAPTPVSAFMHAGLVNAGGILLARFAPVVEAVPVAMTAIFVLGAVSALAGAAMALVQADVKRQLACSTTAQMGFMVLQCGLGFFAAAMAHLVLHGLYKAALFLGAGSAVAAVGAKAEPLPAPASRGRTLALGAIGALAGGVAFALVSGKGTGGLDAGLVLVLFAALAAAQAGPGLIRALGAAPTAFFAVPAVLALTGGLYGGMVRLAEAALAPVPGLVAPQPLSIVHLLVAAVFVVAWAAVLAGAHRKAGALYARLLTAAAPASATVTEHRRAYHA